MTPRFRPAFDALEARDVPAALSSQLTDGSVVSGLFSAPGGVDPGQSWQSLPLDDLTVTKGGVAYAVQPGATATYADGALVGVNATATAGQEMIDLSGTVVLAGAGNGPLVFDAADTMATFTLSDGTVGAVSYEVPWDQVDPDQASQSVAPLNFRLNIAGQNIDTGTPGANFTALPALQFEYGQGTGITFAVDTSALTASGFQYTSFVASFDQIGANVIDAVKAGVGALPASPMVPKASQAAISFNTGANDTKNTILPTGTRVRIHIEAGTYVYDYDGTTIAGETVGDIAEQIQSNMAFYNWDVSLSSNGMYIKVNGKKLLNQNVMQSVTKAGINYSGMAQPVGPKTAGDVQLLILDGDTWKDKPKPQ